jgi:hypothetical protein
MIQWYHSLKFEFASSKKFQTKFLDGRKICVHHPWNFQNQIRNTMVETKKSNPRWIVSQKDKRTNPHYSHSNFSFLFLRVYFKFGSEYSVNFQNQIRNTMVETKKTNPRWIVSQKDKSTNPHYSHSNFSFLFLRVYFKFGSEKLRECKYTSSEHP